MRKKMFFSPLLAIVFFLFHFKVFGQNLYENFQNDQIANIDSTSELHSIDSLEAVNQQTIKHIQEIFSKFKNKRPKIGLVLAGGGAKGFSHVGVLQLLDSLNIPIDYIAGNSMGGLIGALYSIGYDGTELEEFSRSLDWDVLLNDDPPREQLPFIEKKKSGRYQLKIGLKGYEPAIPAGMIYGQNIQLMFIKLTAPYEGVENFDMLPTPFRCVAVDLVTGKQVVLKDGSLAKAMRATMSIPSAFSPVEWNNYLLVDGLVLNNYPVDVVKEMGADIVIGLNLSTGNIKKEDFDNLLVTFDRMLDIPTGDRLRENIENTDIYISQDLRGYSTTDFAPEKIDGIINRGKKASINNQSVISALRKELEKYDEYHEWVQYGKLKSEELIEITKEEHYSSQPVIASFEIYGNDKFSTTFIENHLDLAVGNLFSDDDLISKINELYALNYFENISYVVQTISSDEIHLKISVKEKRLNRLVAGFKYNDYFKLVGLLGLETNSAVIPGAQLETYLKFGGITTWETTVLYPSRSMDRPIYPFISAIYKNIPLDFYLEGKKIFRFDNQSWEVLGGLNFSLSKFWDIEASLSWEWMNVQTEIASPEIEYILSLYDLNPRLVTAKIRLLYDSLDDIIIPNYGIFFNSYFEQTLPDIGAELDYKRLFGRFDVFLPIGKKHNLNLEGAYMKAWKKELVPFYKWFYLGGPETFVGIDYFEAVGTEFTLAALSYRYEIFKSIYLKSTANAIFNFNLIDSSKSDEILWGYGFSAMMRTILGKIEVMWARGDKNIFDPGGKSNKVYFILGFNL